MKEDMEKTTATVIDLIQVAKDVQKAKEDGKITMPEYGAMIVKHAGKAFSMVKGISEITDEVKDIDSNEAAKLVFDIAKELDPDNNHPKLTAHIAELVEGLVKAGYGLAGVIQNLKK